MPTQPNPEDFPISGERRVRLLPDAVASQVAAGEVIERPASVLKELLENSLDAGADRIEVEFSRGGVWLVRVSDNGSGMGRDDALLSLERHATSKIRTSEDLVRVGTFGFRGEALPSIASVSRFRMATRPAQAASGTEILVDGGKLREVRESGESPGTTIEVKNLFFNLPARRKFLRTELTETGHLLQQFQTVALAHPEVALVLRRDGKVVHQCDASGDLRIRVRDLLGEAFREQLIEAEAVEVNGIRLHGLLGRPGSARADRQQQFVFLNRRPVHEAAIARGLREALAGGGEGRPHVPGILFLEMDPEEFDCNVHPAKREVRFHRPDRIRDAVAEFARRAWQPARMRPMGTSESGDEAGEKTPPNFQAPRSASETRIFPGMERMPHSQPLPSPVREGGASAVGVAQGSSSGPESRSPVWTPAPVVSVESDPASEPSDAAPPSNTEEPSVAPASSPGEGFIFRGTLGKRYWLLENGDGLVLLDLRHAFERILYEDLVRRRGDAGMPAQRLLTPVTTRVSPADYAWVAEHSAMLRKAGFEVEPFGGDVVKIEAVPAGLDEWEPSELLVRVLDEIRSGNRQAAQRFLLDQVAVVLSGLRSSRIDSEKLAADRPEDLIGRLLSCDLPYAAPGGQPTLIQWSWGELEKKFR